MVVLKKVNASTLMETLVATVLIVIVFMVASMILNNVFSNMMKSNTRAIDAYLSELQYQYLNGKLRTPFRDDYNEWQITVDLFKINGIGHVEFEGKNLNTNQIIVKELRETEH